MRPAKQFLRLVAVLLVAGLWALSLAWAPAARLAQDRTLVALGHHDCANTHPATETPRFGIDDERPASVAHDGLLESADAPSPRSSVAQPYAPAVGGSPFDRRHRSPCSARGPPVRG